MYPTFLTSSVSWSLSTLTWIFLLWFRVVANLLKKGHSKTIWSVNNFIIDVKQREGNVKRFVHAVRAMIPPNRCFWMHVTYVKKSTSCALCRLFSVLLILNLRLQNEMYRVSIIFVEINIKFVSPIWLSIRSFDLDVQLQPLCLDDILSSPTSVECKTYLNIVEHTSHTKVL